jgi:hypothetical protein
LWVSMPMMISAGLVSIMQASPDEKPDTIRRADRTVTGGSPQAPMKSRFGGVPGAAR